MFHGHITKELEETFVAPLQKRHIRDIMVQTVMEVTFHDANYDKTSIITYVAGSYIYE